MAENKLTGIRADAETTAKFKELSEQFPNAGECLKALINAHEMTQAKQVLTGQETSIADFQAHADSLVKLFIGALDLTANAENRIRQEFQQQLESKDKTIISLQESLEQASNAVQSADERAIAAETTAKAELEQQAIIIADLQTKLEVANQKIEEQNETVRATKGIIGDKEKIIDSMQKELDESAQAAESIQELKEKLITAEGTADSLKQQVSDLRWELMSKEKASEIAAERAEIRLQKAVLAEQKVAAESAKQAIEEVKKLYAENARLKDEINRLKVILDKQ